MRRHRRADAPVGLGRACGSVPWGRGRRHKEREPVFPDQSSGVILQPDCLLRACPHPLRAVLHSLHPCFAFATVTTPSLSQCSFCHPNSPYHHHSIQQPNFCPAVAISSFPSPPSSKFIFFLLRLVGQLSSCNTIFSCTSPSHCHSSPPLDSSPCPSDGPSLPLDFPPSSLVQLPYTLTLQWLRIWVSLLTIREEM